MTPVTRAMRTTRVTDIVNSQKRNDTAVTAAFWMENAMMQPMIINTIATLKYRAVFLDEVVINVLSFQWN